MIWRFLETLGLVDPRHQNQFCCSAGTPEENLLMHVSSSRVMFLSSCIRLEKAQLLTINFEKVIRICTIKIGRQQIMPFSTRMLGNSDVKSKAAQMLSMQVIACSD